MSEAKHAPGPWDWCSYMNTDTPAGIVAADDTEVCTFSDLVGSELADVISDGRLPSLESARANARLIAAAPELLEALRRCRCEVSYLADQVGAVEGGSVMRALKEANDAIAKVEGCE